MFKLLVSYTNNEQVTAVPRKIVMAVQSRIKGPGWKLLAVFLILSLGIAAAGRAYYLVQRAHLSRRVHSELAGIADLQVRRIAAWREDQLGDAVEISNNTLAAAQAARYLADPSDLRLRSDMLDWMRSLLLSGERSAVALLDAQGKVRLAVPGSYRGIHPRLSRAIQNTLATGTAFLSDLHLAPTPWGKTPHLELLVPLRVRAGAGRRTVGVLVLRIDANSFLYPLTQWWPTPSPTAETLLVRRDGGYVLFLNELRHRKGTALRLRMALQGEPTPAVMAVLGREGVLEVLRDYRGVPVVAAARSIPGTTWKLIAKVDEDEAYGPIRHVGVLAFVVVGLLVLGAGLSVGLLWQRQAAEFEAAQMRARLQREALRNHYNYLMHRGHDAILLLDSDMTVVNANDRAAEYFGTTFDELMGRDLGRLHAQAAAPPFADRLRALEEDSGVVLEVEHPRPDGSSFAAEVSARCTTVGGERYYQIIVRDITERKLAEAERARLTAAVEQTAEAVVVQGSDWNVQYINPSFARMTGFSTDEVLGRKLPDILPDGPAREAYRQALSTAQRGEFWESRVAMPRRDGATFDCYVTASPVRDSSGSVAGIVSLLRDVTQHVLLEERLRQSQNLEAIGRLAGGVAHEFNNLMTVVLGFSRIVGSRVSADPVLSKHVEQIIKAAEQATELTQQLLAFSRKQVVQPRVLSPAELVLGMHRVLQRVLGEDIDLFSTAVPDAWSVKADPSVIQQVILNLAANARDAMPEGGKLTIEVANAILDEAYARRHADVTPGPYVVISVTDTGRGMDQETMSHVFEPFYTTKGLANASGLGLASVYGMVKQSGGHISVYSEVGKGTTFRVYLPRFADASDDAFELSPSDVELGRGETVLVVEDDDMVRDLVVEVLGSHGYTVAGAKTPEEAERICRANPETMRLLVADVVMPGMSGEQLGDRLLDIQPGMQILYMSGYPEAAAAHGGHIGRPRHYLSKPFTADGLLKKVRDALDEPARQGGGVG